MSVAVVPGETASPSGPVIPPLRWWGWGDRDGRIAPAMAAILDAELGIDGERVARPVALEDVELPAIALSDEAQSELREAVAGESFSDRRRRVAHAAGKSYPDLMRLREGRPGTAPDAVLFPATEEQIAAVFAVCERHGLAVVPFGGGTSVVGGVAALRGARSGVVALDLARFTGVVIDPINNLARLGAGLRGPDAEAALNERGFTLGHFPQSFEYATIGGFAATRSAGQASSGYGRFDEMVAGLRCVTPRGTVAVEAGPPNAAGPSVLQAFVGSEGTLGVITQVTVRVHPRPVAQWYEMWSVPAFDEGVALLRRLAQAEILPDVARVSDAEESRITLAMAGSAGPWLQRLLRLRGQSQPCLVVVGWDGTPSSVTRRRGAALPYLRSHGAVRLGRRAGEQWRQHRFESPYLRDPLIDRGVLVETLETATAWDRMHDLRKDVAAALKDSLRDPGTEPLVGAHVSHSYPQGASLYFTVMARAGDDPVARWQTAKSRVCDLLVASGATITHHHAVGRDHLPWMRDEIGEAGIEALRALKERFDPAGILNPEKLIPA